MGEDAVWRQTINEHAWVSAFKNVEVPLRKVPGLEHAGRVLPDTMHNFHLGWGQDLAASSICLLARFDLFDTRSRKFDDKLEAAHSSFMTYCHTNKRTTNCDAFSILIFDMDTKLGCPFPLQYGCVHVSHVL